MKSVSFKNLVLFINVMLWERLRSWYGTLVWSGRKGWRTWSELVLTRWKKSSSAVLNRSTTTGTSSLQQLSRLLRRSSESRCVRSAAEHVRPRWHHILNARDNRRTENIVQRRVPCECSTCIAYSRLVPDDSSVVTWSAAVSLPFTVTPRTWKLGTRSLPGSGGDSAPFRRAENMISLVFFRFSLRLLPAAHVCRCAISSLHVYTVYHQAQPDVSSANLTNSTATQLDKRL